MERWRIQFVLLLVLAIAIARFGEPESKSMRREITPFAAR